MGNYLKKIQGICKKCGVAIDKTRVESDKPTARIYCDKCHPNKVK